MDNTNIPAGLPLNGISFSIKRSRVLIYRSTIRELKSPEYIRFLLNKKKHTIAVQCCEQIDQDSFKVPDLANDKRVQFEISSMNFLSIIYEIANWDPKKTYHLTGYYIEKYRLVLYDLNEANVISDDEFVDPERSEE